MPRFTILTFAVLGTLISMLVVGLLIMSTCHIHGVCRAASSHEEPFLARSAAKPLAEHGMCRPEQLSPMLPSFRLWIPWQLACMPVCSQRALAQHSSSQPGGLTQATLATYAHLQVDPLLNIIVFGESVAACLQTRCWMCPKQLQTEASIQKDGPTSARLCRAFSHCMSSSA